ncbi:MAG: tRNA 2-thiocytidine biosynthesis TtcA family protein [Lachnospiraceae bacterium]
MDRCTQIERSIIKRFRKEIWRPFVKGLNEYDMIQEGDQIAVCISGGKDSFLLAKCLQEIQKHGKMEFGLKFLCMDPGYHPANRRMIEENAKIMGLPLHIFESDIFDVVVDAGDSPCYLCARMRRGFLYSNAQQLGCNKIALGHHFDDVIETILMSMIYGAQVNTMMPKLHSTNFPGMELIRPLYMVKEEDILSWKRYNDLQFLQCACRFTEKISQERALQEEVHSSKRQEMKELIRHFRQINPHIEMNIFKSVENVNLDACIGYVRHGERHHFLEEY